MTKETDNKNEEAPKVADLSGVWGMIKKRKMSGQEFKDLVREGWEGSETLDNEE